MKKFFAFAFLMATVCGIAQEKNTEVDYTNKRNGQEIKMAFPIPAYMQDSVTHFVIQKKDVYINLVNTSDYEKPDDSLDNGADALIRFAMRDADKDYQILINRKSEFITLENKETIALWYDQPPGKMYPDDFKAARVLGNTIVELTLDKPLGEYPKMRDMIITVLKNATSKPL